MRIALVNPGKNPKYAGQEPLNLGFIASYLEKHNVEVIIIDELAGQNVAQKIDSYKPDIVGITAVTPLAPDAYRVAKLCRAKGILTVMGGVHASILTEEVLKHVDIVVKGEGELAMLDIARGKIKSGVISKPFIDDINQLPPPARHLFQTEFYSNARDRMPGNYLSFIPKKTKVASILTSRGCPYNCIYCHNTWRGTPCRYDSPEKVVEEIKNLINNYGVNAIFFIEDNFLVNKSRVRQICKLIEEDQIDFIWGANARVDNVDLEILKTLSDAGCRQITFGFESGSQRILDLLKKKTTVEQNLQAIDLCNKAGIRPQGTVMIGNPTETIEDVRATQKFIKEANIENIGVCITTPFPGTELWRMCEERNAIPEGLDWADLDYNKIPILVSDKLSKKQLEELEIETKLVSAQKRKLQLFDILKKIMLNPVIILKALKNIKIFFKNSNSN